MFRYLSFGDIIPQNYIHHQDSLLLLTSSDILLQNEQNFQKYSSLITKVAKIKRAIIVFTTPLTTAHEKSLDMKINIIKGNSLFYIAYQDSSNLNNTRFKQVISIKNTDKAVINPIILNNFGQIIENYNLQGLHIYSYTLSWAPFFTIENCNFEGKNCN